ncbi:magnesium chelatase subunit D [Acidiphilium sp. C61]|uniref:magnesium chelatase subunit D n=1 Tax=Acidiphilium sp. C61 TaxID=1671485 RepID=UPI001917EDE7|nr:magnesium chelatase subunit D [Acidiphilium sp. C61]
MSPMPPPRPARSAAVVAALFSLDPAGLGGIWVRAPFGPARDGFVEHVRALLPAGAAMRRVPAGIDDGRLLGGIDLAASLAAGRRVMAAGLLAEAAGGVLVLPMAERLDRALCARLAQAQEGRFGAIALDEGIGPEEHLSPALADRMAFALDAADLLARRPLARVRGLGAARRRLVRMRMDDGVAEALCHVAAQLGIFSLRPVILAMRTARAAAALAGRRSAGEEDAMLAAQLVLAHRATRLPAPAEQDMDQAPEPPPPACGDDAAPPAPPETAGEQAADRVLDAARSALPPELLAALLLGQGRRGAAGGRAAAPAAATAAHGRPLGARPGRPGREHGLALVDTLRAAAPMQALRRRERPDHPGRVIVLGSDFRVRRHQAPVRSVAIFAVDASGSSALNRLAEAKGAVQLLLADCYVRRDQVALLAFRNRGAELLLPPTAALARARRSLAALPGGGATPLASGIDAARDMALGARRRGNRPLLVLLTDGGANIGRDRQPGRAAAAADARAAASACAADGIPALLIDTAPRPNAFAAELAGVMRARYLPLPFADARALSRAIRAEQAA